MKNAKIKNQVLSNAMLALGLGTACNPLDVVDTGDKPDSVMTTDSVNVTGSGPSSCSAVPSSVNASGKYMLFSYASSACARVTTCIDPVAWKKLPETTYVPGIDVVILFDTTGSMTPYIQAMIRNLQQLITNLNGLTPSLRLGLATFQDFADRGGSPGDLPFNPLVSLTSDVKSVQDKLGTLRAWGGGDTPESLATALRATVDGQPFGKYFGASDMGFTDDPSRVKIVLGITDAPNKRDSTLPAGAAALGEVAQLLKKKGILFFGIGTRNSSTLAAPVSGTAESGSLAGAGSGTTGTVVKSDGGTLPITYPTTLPTGSGVNYGDYTSWNDLAELATVTGAIISEPGLDLDGDGKIATDGEIPAGQPAVLVMNRDGTLKGAPAGADSTKVLANAITSMVKRVKPFQFALNVNGGGHAFTPASNVMTLSPQVSEQRCFTTVMLGRIESKGCPASTDVGLWVTEELSGVALDAKDLKARFEVDLNCIGDITTVPGPVPTPTGLPEPTPTVTVTPTPTPTVTPSPTPTCTNLGCSGGAIGL